MSRVTLLKLGGSLITDKGRPETPRPEVIERLAGEIAASSRPLLIGHGSGSFGHVAAERFEIRGPLPPERSAGVAATQAAAARLHRIVVAAIAEAGGTPFSWAPSSAVVAEAGVPVSGLVEPLWRALDRGWRPVVYGDVVVDRAWGASICSTETLFLYLTRALSGVGVRVDEAVWLGETDGVLDADGRTVPCLDRAVRGHLGDAVGGSAGTDVTGGMAHRLDAAVTLAEIGIPSWIGDGRRPGALSMALTERAQGGTRVRRRCGGANGPGGPPNVSSGPE